MKVTLDSLRFAIKTGAPDQIKKLLRQAKSHLLELLEKAIEAQDTAVTAAILEYDADLLKKKFSSNKTPLMLAFAKRNIALLRAILAYPVSKADQVEFYGNQFPVLLAVHENNVELTALLLEAAERDKFDSQMNQSVFEPERDYHLHIAINNKNLNLLAILFHHGAAEVFDKKNRFGLTPLSLAIQYFDPDVVSYLIDIIFDTVKEIDSNIFKSFLMKVGIVRKEKTTPLFPLLTQQNIQAIVNAALAYPGKHEPSFQALCYNLAEKLLVRLREQAHDWYHDPEEYYLLPLMFFILAGKTKNAERMKGSCYLSLLDRKEISENAFSLLEIKKMIPGEDEIHFNEVMIRIGKYLNKFAENGIVIVRELGDISFCINKYAAAFSFYQRAFGAGDDEALQRLIVLGEIDDDQERLKYYLYYRAQGYYFGIGLEKNNSKALECVVKAIQFGAPDALALLQDKLAKLGEEGYLQARIELCRYYAAHQENDEIAAWCFLRLTIEESNQDSDLRAQKLAYFKNFDIRVYLTAPILFECLCEYQDELDDDEVDDILHEIQVKDESDKAIMSVLVTTHLRNRINLSRLLSLYDQVKDRFSAQQAFVAYVLYRFPFAPELRNASLLFSSVHGEGMQEIYLIHKLLCCNELNKEEKAIVADSNKLKEIVAADHLFRPFYAKDQIRFSQLRLALQILLAIQSTPLLDAEVIFNQLTMTQYALHVFHLIDVIPIKNRNEWKKRLRDAMFSRAETELKDMPMSQRVSKLQQMQADALFSEHRNHFCCGKTKTRKKIDAMLKQEEILKDASETMKALIKQIQAFERMPKAIPESMTELLAQCDWDQIYALFQIIDRIKISHTYEWKGLLRQSAYLQLSRRVDAEGSGAIPLLQKARSHAVFSVHRHTFFLDPRRIGRTKTAACIDGMILNHYLKRGLHATS